MVREHPLKELVRLQKMGINAGICSICSSHPFVIEAAIEKAIEEDTYVLIEATANQVNQYGGYTGMKPADFAGYVKSIAHNKGLKEERLILGGDHLGPLVWKNEPEESAMEKARELLALFVKAGFSKIHIDTSMHLGSDDKEMKLDNWIIASRAAELFAACEKAFEAGNANTLYRPVYVIGSEVPIPGGTQEEEELAVTRVEDLKETLKCFREAFARKSTDMAFENIIALVVQPGVEFGENSIHDYSSEAARELSSYIKGENGIVLEGHSTDYQRMLHLTNMLEDGISIQKVGPALTFALREALLALENIEIVLLKDTAGLSLSGFSEVLDDVMAKNPVYWQNYYRGSAHEQRIARLFSLSDRCRYYLGEPEVVNAISRLLKNLGDKELPLTLLSQFLPEQYHKIREGKLENNVANLIKDKIRDVIDTYPKFS